jgi:uncharacterized protein DUF6527
MKKRLNRIKKWIASKKRFKYDVVSELPSHLIPRVIYIEENQKYPWQIVMICPCGCGSNLHMNLINEYDPFWEYEIDKKDRISLHPSVHRFVGCKSHFFIKKGVIIWCR